MKSMIRVGVVGVTGRMARRVVRLLSEADDLEFAVALERDVGRDGLDAGQLLGTRPLGVPSTIDPERAAELSDVVIDFSAPAACATLGPVFSACRVAYVCASTGISRREQEALDAAAQETAVLEAANLSVGVNVMKELVRVASERLGADFDVEIFEVHHRHKRDAPSGTAYSLGQSVLEAQPRLREVESRVGSNAVREEGSLGYAALRGGDVPGEHTVFFFGAGERLEITHRSSTPDIFAQGALRAARWLVTRGPGRYSMNDVLGIT